MNKNKSRNITTGGILTALSIIFLYFASIVPINSLTLLTITSCFIPIALLRSNLKIATFVYIATSILSIFIVSFKISLAYILFFGIFGLIKFLAEKNNRNRILEIFIKLIFFNFILVLYIVLLKEFFPINIIKIPLILIIILAEIVFFIYDYALSLIICIYLKRFNKY